MVHSYWIDSDPRPTISSCATRSSLTSETSEIHIDNLIDTHHHSPSFLSIHIRSVRRNVALSFTTSLMKCSTVISLLAAAASACEDCYGPSLDGAHVRNVRRMQPDAQGAVAKPRGPLPWGQLNFLHTTDTHGWLQGLVSFNGRRHATLLRPEQAPEREKLWRRLGRLRKLHQVNMTTWPIVLGSRFSVVTLLQTYEAQGKSSGGGFTVGRYRCAETAMFLMISWVSRVHG
jgi:hypothetical protein